jgi:hypothetical protein
MSVPSTISTLGETRNGFAPRPSTFSVTPLGGVAADVACGVNAIMAPSRWASVSNT